MFHRPQATYNNNENYCQILDGPGYSVYQAKLIREDHLKKLILYVENNLENNAKHKEMKKKKEKQKKQEWNDQYDDDPNDYHNQDYGDEDWVGGRGGKGNGGVGGDGQKNTRRVLSTPPLLRSNFMINKNSEKSISLRSIFSGHYSDVYLMIDRKEIKKLKMNKETNDNNEQQQMDNDLDGNSNSKKKFYLKKRHVRIAKLVHLNLCPKLTNCENEFQVCNWLKNNPHRNIIKFKEIIRFDSFISFIMSYGGFMNLEQFIKKFSKSSLKSNYNDDLVDAANDNDDIITPAMKRSLPESLANDIFLNQMIEAMIYLHDNNIVHRDLKPENILIEEKQRQKTTTKATNVESDECQDADHLRSSAHNYHIRLIDFGFAKIIQDDYYVYNKYNNDDGDGDDEDEDKKQAICNSHKGVLEYMAPELLENCLFYDAYKTDVYSMGVVYYFMLFGINPFRLSKQPGNVANNNPHRNNNNNNITKLLQEYRRIKLEPLKFPFDNDPAASETGGNGNENIQMMAPSENSRNLLKKMLDADPKLRPSFKKIRKIMKTHRL